MYFRLLLFSALLSSSSSSGASSADGPTERVVVLAGGDVLLPCSFSVSAAEDFPTVEWSKEGLRPDVVFLYRDGCETPEMKNPAFRYRTSLITRELQNGNVSLRISDVRLEDAGRYRCMRLWRNGLRDVTAVQLVVGAVSDPKLSVVSAVGGGVTLQCEASCWLPEPDINFLDDQGKYIRADDPKREDDARGCFTVTRRVTLQDAHSRVTCRVHQPQTNQTRDTQMIVPVGRSCFLITALAVGGTVLFLLALCGLAVFLWKRCKSAEGQKLPVTRQSSDQSPVSGTSEIQLLLRSGSAVRADELMVQVSDLKSKLREKEEVIRQLQNNNSQLTSVVCHHDQPTILHSPATNGRNPPKSANIPQNQGPIPVPQNQGPIPVPQNQGPIPVPQNQGPIPVPQNQGPVYVPQNQGPISVPQNQGPVYVPQNEGPNPGVFRQSSIPAPDRPGHRIHRHRSSPALLNFASLSSTSEKKLARFGRSMSEACALPRPVVKHHRRHSSVFPLPNNQIALLSDLTEESD